MILICYACTYSGKVRVGDKKDAERGVSISEFQQLTYSWLNVNVYADSSAGCFGRNKKNVTSKQILKDG